MKMAASFYIVNNNEEVLIKRIDFDQFESIYQEVNEIVEIEGTLYKVKGKRNSYEDDAVVTKYLVVENDKANWDLF